MLDGILAIGINAGLNANTDDIKPFLADDRDFAVELSPDFFLDEMNAYLNAPDKYDDVEGKLQLKGTHIKGSPVIAVTGFEAETGMVRQGTRFTLRGSTYTVTFDTEIAANTASLSITPGLLEEGKIKTRFASSSASVYRERSTPVATTGRCDSMILLPRCKTVTSG